MESMLKGDATMETVSTVLVFVMIAMLVIPVLFALVNARTWYEAARQRKAGAKECPDCGAVVPEKSCAGCGEDLADPWDSVGPYRIGFCYLGAMVAVFIAQLFVSVDQDSLEEMRKAMGLIPMAALIAGLVFWLIGSTFPMFPIRRHGEQKKKPRQRRRQSKPVQEGPQDPLPGGE